METAIGEEFKVSLKIVDFECRPEEITSLLRLSPTICWQKGDQIDARIKRRRASSGWLLESKLVGRASIGEQIEDLEQTTSSFVHRFAALPAGAIVSIYCAVFSTSGRPEVKLEVNHIAWMHAIRAGFELDLFRLPAD